MVLELNEPALQTLCFAWYWDSPTEIISPCVRGS